MEATRNTDHLRLLLTVLAAGSFTRAADVTGTDKAPVIRVIARLEDQLSTRLLNRSARSLSATDAGQDLAGRARAILDALAEAEAALKGRADRPKRRLRITCGYEFGILVVNGWVRAHLERRPEDSVDMNLTNCVPDIVHERFDVAICVGALSDSHLKASKMGEIGYGFHAAPGYLARMIARLVEIGPRMDQIVAEGLLQPRKGDLLELLLEAVRLAEEAAQVIGEEALVRRQDHLAHRAVLAGAPRIARPLDDAVQPLRLAPTLLERGKFAVVVVKADLVDPGDGLCSPSLAAVEQLVLAGWVNMPTIAAAPVPVHLEGGKLVRPETLHAAYDRVFLS